MDTGNDREKNTVGNISISHDVIATVAKTATLEIDGVNGVSQGNIGLKGLLTRTNYVKPIKIEVDDGVAHIQISIIVDAEKRIPDLANAVQFSVKNAVQSMTGLTVSGVDVVIAGITQNKASAE